MKPKINLILLFLLFVLAGCKADDGSGLRCGIYAHCPEGFKENFMGGECLTCINESERKLSMIFEYDVYNLYKNGSSKTNSSRDFWLLNPFNFSDCTKVICDCAINTTTPCIAKCYECP